MTATKLKTEPVIVETQLLEDIRTALVNLASSAKGNALDFGDEDATRRITYRLAKNFRLADRAVRDLQRKRMKIINGALELQVLDVEPMIANCPEPAGSHRVRINKELDELNQSEVSIPFMKVTMAELRLGPNTIPHALIGCLLGVIIPDEEQ